MDILPDVHKKHHPSASVENNSYLLVGAREVMRCGSHSSQHGYYRPKEVVHLNFADVEGTNIMLCLFGIA